MVSQMKIHKSTFDRVQDILNKAKNKKIVAKSHHKMRKKTRTFQITHDIIKLCKINGVC